MRGVIIQIVPWERRKNFYYGGYYGKIEYGTEPMDVMVACDPERVKFWDRIKKKAKFEAIWMAQSIAIPVKRPHDYKVGDEIDIDVSIKKINN
jgi:hypothetical protein